MIILTQIAMAEKPTNTSIGLGVGIGATSISDRQTDNNFTFDVAVYKRYMWMTEGMKNIYGLNVKLDGSFYIIDATNIVRLPVTFEYRLISKGSYLRDTGIDLYAGPEIGYILSTKVTNPGGEYNPLFAGVTAGIRYTIWDTYIELYGHRALTSTFSSGKYYVNGFGICFGKIF